MKVSLCQRCPYAPGDIAEHYDSGAAERLCCGCEAPLPAAPKYPLENYRTRTKLGGLVTSVRLPPKKIPYAGSERV